MFVLIEAERRSNRRSPSAPLRAGFRLASLAQMTDGGVGSSLSNPRPPHELRPVRGDPGTQWGPVTRAAGSFEPGETFANRPESHERG